MINRVLDPIDRFVVEHPRAMSAFSVAFFIASCAVNGELVALPQWFSIEDRIMLYGSIAWNALWWGFGYPYVMKRREERALANKNDNDMIGTGSSTYG